VKLASHLNLVPRLRMLELYLHSLIRLHGVALNGLSIGTDLSYLSLGHERRVATYEVGRAIAQAVSRWLPTSAVRVQNRV
jgi:hypothetical protein